MLLNVPATLTQTEHDQKHPKTVSWEVRTWLQSERALGRFGRTDRTLGDPMSPFWSQRELSGIAPAARAPLGVLFQRISDSLEERKKSPELDFLIDSKANRQNQKG